MFEYHGNMDIGGTAAVDAALDALSVSVDHLVKLVEDGGLETCTEGQLVGFLQGFERVRNRLPLVDHAAVGEASGGIWRRGCVSPAWPGCSP